MTAPQESNVNNALALIDRLEALVVNSVHIPMTTKVLVDEEDLFELLDYLREYLPQEIQEAQNIIENQATILQEARDTAEKMVSKTKERTREFLQEHALVQQAQKMAAETRKTVQTEAEKQRYEADKYSEQVLADLEQKINRALTRVKTGRSNLGQTMTETAQKLGL